MSRKRDETSGQFAQKLTSSLEKKTLLLWLALMAPRELGLATVSFSGGHIVRVLFCFCFVDRFCFLLDFRIVSRYRVESGLARERKILVLATQVFLSAE